MMGIADHGPEDFPVSVSKTVGPRVGPHELILLLLFAPVVRDTKRMTGYSAETVFAVPTSRVFF